MFTRLFAASNKYGRVLGCDYSESMLLEARRRVSRDPLFQPSNTTRSTRVDLVRLDVGQIPMQDSSVDCLHAGAAMHCWPDLDAAILEIHRVLKPGGRYFATTFLSDFWKTLHVAEGGLTGPNQQAFQFFESMQSLEGLLERGGFSKERIRIEVLKPSCVVIRAEKGLDRLSSRL
jgi:ubiquinone/menaquinone biosynthesis C-methylase UbiE